MANSDRLSKADDGGMKSIGTSRVLDDRCSREHGGAADCGCAGGWTGLFLGPAAVEAIIVDATQVAAGDEVDWFAEPKIGARSMSDVAGAAAAAGRDCLVGGGLEPDVGDSEDAAGGG